MGKWGAVPMRSDDEKANPAVSTTRMSIYRSDLEHKVFIQAVDVKNHNTTTY